ncbi:hypothetical protein HK098_003823 [Nowakowskiella sp. JEL0407]|nr:hypothetical protein HK098_003823 [Nowakowskiella sp. JEL0407]
MNSKLFSTIKGLLQIVALAGVLFFWSGLDTVVGSFKQNSNQVRLWFNPTPKEMHIGEMLNVSISYEAKVKLRKVGYKTVVHLGVRCSGNKDNNVTFHTEEFIIQQEWGGFFYDLNMTSDTLLPSVSTALCFLRMDYKYTAAQSNSEITKTEIFSPVFRLSRTPRLIPLPPDPSKSIIPLEPNELTLFYQVRNATVVPNISYTNPIVLPVKYRYPYNAFSLWPEDDVEFIMNDKNVAKKSDLWKWILIFLGVWICLATPVIRDTFTMVVDALDRWWNSDIQLATEGLSKEEIRRRRERLSLPR